MKLESLKLEKFSSKELKREQMFQLNGGGTKTGGGSGCAAGIVASDPTGVYSITYGYDVIRTNPDGSTYTTYHDRTKVMKIEAANCIGL